MKVNGTVVTELGTKADPDIDHIRVNGKLLQGAQHHVYLLLNKPKGYVTTVSDPENRPTVMQLIRGVKKRVYPVGRLDYASEGLLLLTNDGALANKLMKAASQVSKTYVVKVAGSSERRGDWRNCAAEFPLPPTMDAGCGLRRRAFAWLRKRPIPGMKITLIEGRNRRDPAHV